MFQYTDTGKQLIPLNNPADNNVSTGTFNVTSQTISQLNGSYTISSSSGTAADGFKTDNYCDLSLSPSYTNGENYTGYSSYTSDSATGGFYPNATTSQISTVRRYTGSASLGGISGEWLKIQFPFSFVPKKYGIYLHPYTDRRISTHTLLASNDGSNWTTIKATNNNCLSSSTNNDYRLVVFDLDTQGNSYSYYAVVISVTTRPGGGTASGNASVRLHLYS